MRVLLCCFECTVRPVREHMWCTVTVTGSRRM